MSLKEGNFLPGLFGISVWGWELSPSTFAQATKLKRAAAAKEKELVKSQELHNKEKKVAHETYAKALMILKVVAYLILIFWFWGDSVAAVSHQLMQPFGKLVSWRAGVSTNGLVTVNTSFVCFSRIDIQ
ncbi:hypothetical protein GIB67_026819 [Kingdonia uniflora]|uniref:Uncharacterized protein n=1 Tax=Kingdonia uniflora TaxID=39325 RepID=A0A7J7MHH9_9MAGN|nr:hypothetical protein GIB67_026819 [Kingdonia uniflora]